MVRANRPNSDPIYLDANATLAPLPEVVDAVTALHAEPLNASSIHQYGAKAKQLLEAARSNVMNALNAYHMQVTFTATGTEANNLALKGLADQRHLLVSAIEHPSILQVAKSYEHSSIIPVTKDGIVDVVAFDKLLAQSSQPALVSVMLANNETGVIQPIKQIAEIAHGYDALVHVDASQAIGKIPVDIGAMDADLVTISGHKCGGVQGAAALLAKKTVPVKPQINGGGQEMWLRAGTENIPAIVGLGVACAHINHTIDKFEQQQTLRDAIESQLASISPAVSIFGKGSDRLPNTVCIAMPGVKQETQLIHFDLANIAVSSGSACSSGKIDVSHVLLAMGEPKEIAQTAIRVSLTPDTSQADIEAFIDSWVQLFEMQLAKRNLAKVRLTQQKQVSEGV